MHMRFESWKACAWLTTGRVTFQSRDREISIRTQTKAEIRKLDAVAASNFDQIRTWPPSVVCSLLCIPAKFSNQTMGWKSVPCQSCSDRDWKRSFFSLKLIKPVFASFPEKVRFVVGLSECLYTQAIYNISGNGTGVSQALLSFQAKWVYFLKYLAETWWVLFCAVGAN